MFFVNTVMCFYAIMGRDGPTRILSQTLTTPSCYWSPTVCYVNNSVTVNNLMLGLIYKNNILIKTKPSNGRPISDASAHNCAGKHLVKELRNCRFVCMHLFLVNYYQNPTTKTCPAKLLLLADSTS